MDDAQDYAAQAQRWHETDHGKTRGKRKRKPPFTEPRADDVPENVAASFRDCQLCNATERGALAPHSNPFWYRVIAEDTQA